MNKDSKIFIAGHEEMIGSSLMRCLREAGFTNLVITTPAELDLSNQKMVFDFFMDEKPDYVFLATAKMGGILANSRYPAEFIYNNIQSQNNVIHSAWKSGVKKLLFLGSSCIYPKGCPQPMKEEYLMSGKLEPTSEPYAIAKITGIRMCQSYNIQSALDKNWVSEGANVKEFEQGFASKFGYKHAIATSSGTDADIVSCASLYEFGAKRGDEIIVPALTFVASANSILAAGFIPKFVDIEVETLNIDPLKIEEAIIDKTRAIMVVHLMGKPCEMDSILEIAEAHNLKIIEDACEAHGATYKGRVVGSIGDMGTFSFYAAHVVVAGEGGMVVTNNDEIAIVVRSVKSHGRPPGSIYFDFQRIGFNSRMNELTAAIGLEGVEYFDQTFNKRKNNLYKLLELTKELSDYLYLLKEEGYEKVSPHAFPLVLKDKKYDCARLYHYLESKGIQCKTLFGSLPTQHQAFKFLNYKYGQFPAAEYVGENGLHFGIHQYLNDDDLHYISDTLKGYFK